MAHPEQRDFIFRVKEKYLEFFKGKKVLDIGSLDINGSEKNGTLQIKLMMSFYRQNVLSTIQIGWKHSKT